MEAKLSSESEVVTVDVHAAKALIINSGHLYLDVRTEEEFKKGHVDVENTLNIAYMFNTPEGRVKNPQFLEQVMAACKKDDLLIVGCQSGVRSLYASADLLKADYKHVSNMGGGYLAWVENKFAVKKVVEEEQIVANKVVEEEQLAAKKVAQEEQFAGKKLVVEQEKPCMCHEINTSCMPEAGEIKIM